MLQNQTQKLTTLAPADPLGARFCKWFNHGWHWIYAEAPAPRQKAQWLTENRYQLKPRNLWQEYQNPEKIIGLRFDNYQTHYCLLDIDRGSPYHPARDRAQFNSVLAALEDIGLCRPLLVRSSDSEGIHVYYFLPEPVPTFALACAVKFALEDASFHLRSGHLEAFPNCKSYSKDKPTDYNGHRLPLQTGSYWLDSDGLPTTDDLGQFLDAADLAAANQDMAALQKAIAAAAKNRRRLRFTPDISYDAAEWKRHLEERIAEGWTGQSQTNDLLLDFARYGHVFLHLEGDALVDYVEAQALAAPGYKRWCRHQHEIRRRATERSRGVDNGFYVKYRGFPKRSCSYRENFEQPQNNIVKLENQANASSRQQAAERIRQAMAHLQVTDTLPYGSTTRAAAIIATVKELTGRGMSLATLHKSCHLPLWYPGSKSLEPAQGAILHPTPLYEGVGQNGLPPSPPQGGGGQQPIQPDFEQGGESEGGNLPVSAPATQEQPIAPAASPVSSVLKLPCYPTGASVENIRRLTAIRVKAVAHAEKEVTRQGSVDSVERLEKKTTAMMQYLWDSGDLLWRDEVKFWLTANPSRRLNL